MNIGNYLIHHRKFFLFRWLSRIIFSCEINTDAEIDKSVHFDHNGMGIIVGGGVINEGTGIGCHTIIGQKRGECP